MQFENLTDHELYPYQIATYEALAKSTYPLPLWERVWVRGKYVSSGHRQGEGRGSTVCLGYPKRVF